MGAPGSTGNRKHPVVARNAKGEVCLVWAETNGFTQNGSIAWQVFDGKGRASQERGSAQGLPPFSFAAVFAMADGSFAILY